MRFELPIGDWSKDGHEKCETFIVSCSHEFMEQVLDDYLRIPEVTGIDIGSVATDYEDRTIPEEYVKKLSDMGLPSGHVDKDYQGTWEVCGARSFAELVVFLLNKTSCYGNYMMPEKEDLPSLATTRKADGNYPSIGGYGLFY